MEEAPSGTFSARPGPELHAAMVAAAKRDDASLTTWANDLFSRATGGLPLIPRSLDDLVMLDSLSSADAERLATWRGGIVIGGLVHSGKTTLARAIARERAHEHAVMTIVGRDSNDIDELTNALPNANANALSTIAITTRYDARLAEAERERLSIEARAARIGRRAIEEIVAIVRRTAPALLVVTELTDPIRAAVAMHTMPTLDVVATVHARSAATATQRIENLATRLYPMARGWSDSVLFVLAHRNERTRKISLAIEDPGHR